LTVAERRWLSDSNMAIGSEKVERIGKYTRDARFLRNGRTVP
jgi:hypothetical protein